MINKYLFFSDLGYHQYKKIWSYQQNIFNSIINLKLYNKKTILKKFITPNYLLFAEHPHVYTMGKSFKNEHILSYQKKIDICKVDRGGSITYHGPGQLLVYPILDLDHFFNDISKYLRSLEEVVIQSLSYYGLIAHRSYGETGVWLDVNLPQARKICAIGIRISHWVTMHGFALNINNDIKYFQDIIPCGIKNKKITSLAKEIGHEISINEVKNIIKKNFCKIFKTKLLYLGSCTI